VTVCIAARCMLQGNPVIVGASDRMVSSADIEFEPPQSKILALTNSIAMLVAGDTAAQAQIFYRTHAEIAQRLSIDKSWFSVEEAANIVGRNVIRYHREMSERLYLLPFGLDSETFIRKQQQLAPHWMDNISDKILNLEISTSTIVAGLDAQGSHVYTVDSRGRPKCDDYTGFSAIGYGEWHASSQFMFANHSSADHMAKTILLTYTAKKRAEVAPGVGSNTDVFVIANLGGFTMLEVNGINYLDKHYQDLKAKSSKASDEVNAAITGEMDEFIKGQQPASGGQEAQQAGAESPKPQTTTPSSHPATDTSPTRE
jgi:20S proteasome alpha/beta subunit